MFVHCQYISSLNVYEVRVNGKRVNFCVCADDAEGYAVYLQRDLSGRFVRTDDGEAVKTFTTRGKVEIINKYRKGKGVDDEHGG
jgi:hypothetical protein